MINREWVMIIGTQCTSERILNTDSDLDWRWSHKTLLMEYGTESGQRHNIKVIENLETFPESINTPSYEQWFNSYDLYKLGCCWNFLFEPNELTHRLQNLGLKQVRPKDIPSIKVIWKSTNSLKRVTTQNFDIERMKQKGLRLKGFLRYDFELESIFKFPLVFMVCFLM
jgi:hypothetical protein